MMSEYKNVTNEIIAINKKLFDNCSSQNILCSD